MHSAGSTFDSRLGRQETKPVLCFYFGPSLLSSYDSLSYETKPVFIDSGWLELSVMFFGLFLNPNILCIKIEPMAS